MSKLFAHLRSYGRGTVSKHMSNLDEMKKAKIQPLLRRQVLWSVHLIGKEWSIEQTSLLLDVVLRIYKYATCVQAYK